MYLIKTRDDDILNLETGDLYHLEKNLLPENCHVKKNDELAVSGGAACLRLWEHLLSLLEFDATKAQDAPQGRTNIRQHADTCQRRIVEIREVDPKGQNLIDELIHLEAYRDGLLTALEYIDDATQDKLKIGSVVFYDDTECDGVVRGVITDYAPPESGYEYVVLWENHKTPQWASGANFVEQPADFFEARELSATKAQDAPLPKFDK